MEITEVRIKLMEDPHERLKAFCSVTLDSCFVVRDLKLIAGKTGPFVAMPSRKLTDRCPRCHTKNHLRAAFCNQCGCRLQDERAVKDEDGRARLYADIAHPINSTARDQIQQAVLEAYQSELVLAQQPGYVSNYDDLGEEQFAELHDRDLIEEVPRFTNRTFRLDAAEELAGDFRSTDRLDEEVPIYQGRGEREFSEEEFGEGLI